MNICCNNYQPLLASNPSTIDMMKYEEERKSPTVATETVNVALVEHCTISSSSWMIFFIRDTGVETVQSSFFFLIIWLVTLLTGKSALAGNFIGGRGGLGGFFG